MSKSNYAGLDYSGPGSTVNRDAETGIRYGVISQNSIQPDVMSDIWSEARDLSYEAAKKELLTQLQGAYLAEEDESDEAQANAICGALRDLYYGESHDEERGAVGLELVSAFQESRGWTQDMIDDLVWSIVGDRFGDRYDDNGDRSWLWEKDGYTLSNCLISDVFVSKSPYFTYAQFCSPCVPGAGSLDNHFPWNPVLEPRLEAGNILYCRLAEKAGYPKVFCLGHDFFENEEAPYPVFSVATGNRVVMVEKSAPCPSCNGTGIRVLTGAACGNCRGTKSTVQRVEVEQ